MQLEAALLYSVVQKMGISAFLQVHQIVHKFSRLSMHTSSTLRVEHAGHVEYIFQR
jgi:hypothetical protein